MSLYTLHRPHDWESVVGQKYTKDILQTAMRMDKV
jgi:DNA polymerase III gamma/tau subunit